MPLYSLRRAFLVFLVRLALGLMSLGKMYPHFPYQGTLEIMVTQFKIEFST